MSSIFEDRRRALEDSFFAQRDHELLERLKQNLAADQCRAALRSATGINDPDTIQRVMDLGISPETMSLMSLVPLILVAWADGTINERERAAIVQATSQEGISSAELLDNWLIHPPQAKLQETWTDYVRALTEKLPADARQKMQQCVLGRCQRVAQSAGGFLGVGSISKAEQDVLDSLAKTFD